MKTSTYWVKEVEFRDYPSLKADLETEVLVIGAGITGILSAYLLAKSRKKVTVIEKDTIAEGATHLTTAFLTEIIDTDLHDMIKIYGEKNAKEVIRSHHNAIQLIEDIVKGEKIDCQFERCSNYIFINDNKQFPQLLKEYEAAHKLGIECIISQEPLPGFKNFGYIEIRNQAKFHPLKFLEALLERLEEMGVEIYESTEAESITSQPILVNIRGDMQIKCSWVIAATHDPFSQPVGLFFKKGSYTSYIMQAQIPKDVIPKGIYEDMENPYHYFRIDPTNGKDLISIGGEDHRSDIPISDDKNFDALEEYLSRLLGTQRYEIVNKWDGPILEPSDGLALIGPYKDPHVLYAFGFSGNGMTYAGISALIFKDLIQGHENASYQIFRANRSLDPKSLFRKALDYGGEFIHGAAKNLVRRKKN